jgi:hypothetical protein
VRDAEVDELHEAVEGEHHVAGLDVAVDDGAWASARVQVRVGGVQAQADVAKHPRGDGEREPLPFRGQRRTHGAERLAGDELHREEQLARLRVLPEVEHLAEVGVVQLGAHLRLVEEHGDEVLVARDVGENALERDELLETARPLQPREEQLGHAADGEPGDELIPTDALPAEDAVVHGRRHCAPDR